MGTTLSNIQSAAMLALNRHSDTMLMLQEQVATGSRINRASDDSVGASQVIQLRTTQAELTNYIKNLNEVNTTLNISASTTTNVSELLNNDIRVLLTQISSGTYNDDNRNVVAGKINEFLENILALANTEHMGQYIFSGSTPKTVPYQATWENGQIVSVDYVGSQTDLSMKTAGGIETISCRSGDDVFGMNTRSESEVIGDPPGITLGQGTSSVTGFTWVEVTHNTTAGQYEITINGGVDTVIVPDDGSGSANLAITDSQTGQTLYIDATQPIEEGATLVASPGTYDVFDTVITIRDICADTKNLQGSKWMDTVNYATQVLQDMSSHLLENSSTTGSREEFLTGIIENLEDAKFDAESHSSSIEEADIAQIAIELSRSEVLYEMSLSVTGKMLSMNLLDFIR